MSKPTPIAVAVADLHLSLTQPACRADKDWMEVQARYLAQLKAIAGGLPILCAGDIFDRWNTPPELINFALRELPDGMFCVPGQHDLPNHRIDLVERSGYGVLVQAGKIQDLSGKMKNSVGKFPVIRYYGFGWEETILPPDKSDRSADIHIAIIHRYCWTIGHSYPDAPEDSHLAAYAKKLKGYDVAVFGDNHKGFLSQASPKGPTVLNCGTFIRRKSDEIGYVPAVGVIYSDGSVKRKCLNTSEDRFHEHVEDAGETPIDMRDFLKQLENLAAHGLNFRDVVEEHLRGNDVSEDVKQIILTAMETKQI